MKQINYSQTVQSDFVPNPIVQTDSLTKRYGNMLAVDKLNITVYEGDVYGLLGPNGAGKTTIIAMMLGLVYPTHGSVQIAGYSIASERQKALQTVGAMIETPAFYPYLSGRDNLYIMGSLRQKINKIQLDEILEWVGLRAHQHKRFNNYSLGMKQRLAIGLTLLHDPKLLILDEPTNGLDPHGTVEIRKLILELSRQGRTVILCSHLLSEVEQVCNRLAILNRGQLVTEGPIKLISGEDSLEETFLKLTELPA
ncbi:Efflux ABC transporter, ATP-binding protein [hydrothermal vent metagenome]|uniref:Efflux ABC transporter, ATP-binding protein n=1 Tax=hydrothermal vent metagenome TaxID=652676 RepID=A0A3B0UHX9_9ZZZZ